MEKSLKIQTIKVLLEGISDIMFDRFIDHSKEDRPAEQKLYLVENNQLVFPSENITAFLFGELPPGCAKAFEGRKGKEYIRMGMSHVFFSDVLIPFKAKGKKIIFRDFDNGQFSIYRSAGKTKLSGGGIIKQPMKDRPILRLPWELSFDITLIDNALINESKLYNWFVSGGILIAFGTYRPRFGRFIVKSWDVKD